MLIYRYKDVNTANLGIMSFTPGLKLHCGFHQAVELILKF